MAWVEKSMQDAIYHMEEKMTWFAIIIRPANDSLLPAQRCKCFRICPNILLFFFLLCNLKSKWIA